MSFTKSEIKSAATEIEISFFPLLEELPFLKNLTGGETRLLSKHMALVHLKLLMKYNSKRKPNAYYQLVKSEIEEPKYKL